MSDLVLRLQAAAKTLHASRLYGLLAEAAERIAILECDLAMARELKQQSDDAYVALREIFKIKDMQC